MKRSEVSAALLVQGPCYQSAKYVAELNFTVLRRVIQLPCNKQWWNYVYDHLKLLIKINHFAKSNICYSPMKFGDIALK